MKLSAQPGNTLCTANALKLAKPEYYFCRAYLRPTYKVKNRYISSSLPLKTLLHLTEEIINIFFYTNVLKIGSKLFDAGFLDDIRGGN